MGSPLLILALGLLVSTVGVVPVSVFAANTDCDHLPDPCNGTEKADTVTASGIEGHVTSYAIFGNGGEDKINVKNVDITFNLLIRGGADNDIITASSDRNIGATGDEGNDIIVISGTGALTGFGGTGADKVTADERGSSPVQLFQNFITNEPDGKKDFLDCKNHFFSIAYISAEDGDVAVHCDTVKTGPFGS